MGKNWQGYLHNSKVSMEGHLFRIYIANNTKLMSHLCLLLHARHRAVLKYSAS